jgi:DNA-binding SARP family transcriptional activator
MEYLLLGPLEVLDGDRLLQLGGSKRRAVLALLILNANEVVSTDRLAEDLWGSDLPANAAGSIHNHVSRLRKELGPEILATHRWGYVLRTEPDSIDLRRFERKVDEAEALPAAQRAQRLAEALALWRGPPLADLAFEPALSSHIARLEERRSAVLEQRIDADLEAGRDAELVGELEGLVAASPLREHFRWQLILALYRSGRQAEGLEVYRETRRLLADELGLEPSPELRELERAVLRQDPALAVAKASAAAVVIDRTWRARRRARAAIIATLALAALAAAGYALATATAWTSKRSPVAAVAQSGRPALSPVAHHPLTRAHRVVLRRRRSATRSSSRPGRAAAVRSVVPAAVLPSSSPVAATTTVTQTASGVNLKPTSGAKADPSPITTTTVRPPTTTGPPTTTRPTTTTSPATTTAPPGPPGPPTLADATGWWMGENSQQVVVTQATGVVTMAISATAPDGFNAALSSRCRVEGDFDAEVGFRLMQWPGADGINVTLMAADLGGVNTYRTDAFGESYGAYIPPSGGKVVPATGNSGTLRLARAGSEFTGSYNDGTGWVTIFSGTGPIQPTSVQLGVFNNVNVGAFGGRPATISFDSFTLNADTLDC